MSARASVFPCVVEKSSSGLSSATFLRRCFGASARTLASGGRLLLRTGRAGLRYPARQPLRFLAAGAVLALLTGAVALLGLHLWASHHYRAARFSLEHYRNAEALDHLQICLRIWPGDADALLLAARAARRMGAWEQAGNYLDEYLRQRGDDENVSLEGALLGIERGELERFRPFCQALVERGYPATPLILEALVHSCLRLYRLEEAWSYLQQWLERQPDDPQATLYQAWVLEQHQQLHAAADSYRRAVELDPERLDARARLVDILLRLGEYEEVFPHLEHLRQHQMDDPQVRVQFALYHLHFGQRAEAERLLEEVLARRPHYPPALAARGRLAVESGQLAIAEKWLRQAIAQEPGDYSTRYQLFLCLQRNGKEAEAEEELRQAQQIQRDMVRLQEIVNHHMGQTPHDPSLHLEVALIFFRAGQSQEAKRWLDSALKEDPNHAPTHKALMTYYQGIGEFGRAAEHRRKAGIRSPALSSPR